MFGEDEALTWGTVASASGVNEPRHYTPASTTLQVGHSMMSPTRIL